MPTKPPSIAVTMGDPAGIGPEVCLRLLADRALCAELGPRIYGDLEILRETARATGLPEPDPESVMDCRAIRPGQVTPGMVSAETGRASFTYIEAAIRDALSGAVRAVTTGPINKEAISAAGISFPGHTEMFTDRTGAERSCMLLTTEEISCGFVTLHTGYRDVPDLLSTQRILDVIELTAEAMSRLRGRAAKLLVLGLNPHAGERGLFGDREEERFIEPAIAAAREAGIDVEGPVPPDTAFLPDRLAAFDGWVCMYHDQGHIPMKMVAFDKAINVTLGLPVIRTSVDHGTALDIAGQGKANPCSLFAAVKLAARLADRA